jgi:uncharacterized membrane protein
MPGARTAAFATLTRTATFGVVGSMRRTSALAALLLAACGQPAPDNMAETTSTGAPPVEAPEAGNAGAPAREAAGAVSACLIQDGGRIADNALRAIGTEPFWAVDVKGRCVTYSTPENQAGVRLWTRFEGTSENGQWTGALDGHPFVMRTRPEPGCSDGMSDNVYPIAVSITVRGEVRSGCAEPRQ